MTKVAKANKNQNFVYLYKTLSEVPVYVGYGHTVSRALTHSGGSHNKELKAEAPNSCNSAHYPKSLLLPRPAHLNFFGEVDSATFTEPKACKT